MREAGCLPADDSGLWWCGQARTVRIAAAGQAVPGPGSWPTTAAAAGRPLDEVTDPFALEVYRPVQPEDPPSGAAGGGALSEIMCSSQVPPQVLIP